MTRNRNGKFDSLMSSAAHRSGRVEFWILNIKYLLLWSIDRRNGKRYSKFRIQVVQIYELPRILLLGMKLSLDVGFFGTKYLIFVSSRSVKMRELSFPQFVYFCGKVCSFFNFWMINTLSSRCKETEQS